MGRITKSQPSSLAKPTMEESHDSPIIIAPPFALDNRSAAWNSTDGDSKQKGMLQQVFGLVKVLRAGSTLTSFPVPPQFNMPKSQLQLFVEQFYCCGQNLLDQCADEDDPIERFLAVVRWDLSLTRPTPFLKSPYNPILGETHHVSAGDLNIITEQVSHHPPISVLYATNAAKKIEVFQSSQPVPKLYGASIEVSINGTRTLTLGGRGETYEMTTPVLSYRFLPSAGALWIGDTIVRCVESGLAARISYKSRSFMGWTRGCTTGINGTISKILPDKEETLFSLSGCWDKSIEVEDVNSGSKKVLYDARAALTNLRAPVIKSQDIPATESLLVWSKVTEGLFHEKWESARRAKISVEEKQRELRKGREKEGLTWQPQFFKQTTDDDWEWRHTGTSVPKAPIVA